MLSTTKHIVLVAFVLVAIHYSAPCDSFAATRSILLTSGRTTSAGLRSFAPVQRQRSTFLAPSPTEVRRFMAEADATEEADESSSDDEIQESDTNKSKRKDLDEEKGGITRTVLLAGPLFCKFVIVLVIKFLTDLVVFPLLLLYRLARLTKRRILRLFRREGSSSSPASAEESQQ